jgi:hypothetical protein
MMSCIVGCIGVKLWEEVMWIALVGEREQEEISVGEENEELLHNFACDGDTYKYQV